MCFVVFSFQSCFNIGPLSSSGRFFCMKISSREGSMWDYLLWLGVGQLPFSSNQIAGFLNHQYIWKGSRIIDTPGGKKTNWYLSFLCRELVSKGRYGTTFLVKFDQVCLLPNQIKGFLEQYHLLEKVGWYLSFLWMD